MPAEILMLCSGKGGTGKSTVSVLTGASLAAQGKRVLLIELDSGLRSVDIIAGVYGKTVYDIEDVLCGLTFRISPSSFQPTICRPEEAPMSMARYRFIPMPPVSENMHSSSKTPV